MHGMGAAQGAGGDLGEAIAADQTVVDQAGQGGYDLFDRAGFLAAVNVE